MTKNKGGRPLRVFQESELVEISELAATLTQKQIAAYYDMTEPTFINIKKRQPEVLLAYKRGQAKKIDTMANFLFKAAEGGNVSAMIFYLKTKGGWRETGDPYNYEDEEENKGPTPVLVKFVGMDHKDKMKDVTEKK